MAGDKGGQVSEKSAHFCAYTAGVEWTSETIRREREARGWSQRRLAQAIGASPRAVTAWEAGEAKPSGRNRAALDRVLTTDEPRPGPLLIEATDMELAAEVLRRLSQRREAETLPKAHDPADPNSHTLVEDGHLLTQSDERIASDG